MINQPEPVFSFTIPFYCSLEGETNELFVSEKTYEKYLNVLQKEKNVMIISGLLHPISQQYGDVTTSLFDLEKVVIIIGIKDLEEYTNELLDISIAQELEKINLLDKQNYFRFLYHENTPELAQIFIDDIQQTLEEIHISKRLIKEGYRITDREQQISLDILQNAVQWSAIKNVSPYENEHGLFLLCKLYFLSYVEKDLFQQYKKQLQRHYPLLFIEVEKLLKLTKKINLTTIKGREKALVKILNSNNYMNYTSKIHIEKIERFTLPFVI